MNSIKALRLRYLAVCLVSISREFQYVCVNLPLKSVILVHQQTIGSVDSRQHTQNDTTNGEPRDSDADDDKAHN